MGIRLRGSETSAPLGAIHFAFLVFPPLPSFHYSLFIIISIIFGSISFLLYFHLILFPPLIPPFIYLFHFHLRVMEDPEGESVTGRPVAPLFVCIYVDCK